jgi:hypothetical protein
MKTIWKYNTLVNGAFSDRFEIEMPKNATILCVQRDEKTSIPCIWAMVDTDAKMETRHFELLCTGQKFYQDMGVERKYIGTYQYQRGEFIGHLFERTN